MVEQMEEAKQQMLKLQHTLGGVEEIARLEKTHNELRAVGHDPTFSKDFFTGEKDTVYINLPNVTFPYQQEPAKRGETLSVNHTVIREECEDQKCNAYVKSIIMSGTLDLDDAFHRPETYEKGVSDPTDSESLDLWTHLNEKSSKREEYIPMNKVKNSLPNLCVYGTVPVPFRSQSTKGTATDVIYDINAVICEPHSQEISDLFKDMGAYYRLIIGDPLKDFSFHTHDT